MRVGSRLRANSVLGYLVTALGMGAAIAFVLLLGQVLVIPNAGVLYLLVVIASAYWLGTGPAILGIVPRSSPSASSTSHWTRAWPFSPLDSPSSWPLLSLPLSSLGWRGGPRPSASRLLAEAGRRAAELDAAFDAIPDGLVVYGAGGEIVYATRATERMLGYSGGRARSLDRREDRASAARDSWRPSRSIWRTRPRLSRSVARRSRARSWFCILSEASRSGSR